MTLKEYQDYVERGMHGRAGMGKPDDAKSIFLEMVGELGEVLNAYKHARVWPDGGATSEEHLGEELGDLMWYIFALCTALGFSVESVVGNNISKLNDRYGNVSGNQHP